MPGGSPAIAECRIAPSRDQSTLGVCHQSRPGNVRQVGPKSAEIWLIFPIKEDFRPRRRCLAQLRRLDNLNDLRLISPVAACTPMIGISVCAQLDEQCCLRSPSGPSIHCDFAIYKPQQRPTTGLFRRRNDGGPG
jgi:hypothetical protein